MTRTKTEADVNWFGGANPNGLYVPMTDTEMEVMARIFEPDDVEIVVHGWGTVHKVQASFGDHRVGLMFRLDFTKPAAPMDVHFFDLELRIRSTRFSLLRQRYPVVQGGVPLQVCAGVFVDLQWDIAIDHMSPELVKAIVPGAIGLTSRRLDKDTHERTQLGNMDLGEDKQKLLHLIDTQAQTVRQNDAIAAAKATKDAGYTVTETANGIAVPDPI